MSLPVGLSDPHESRNTIHGRGAKPGIIISTPTSMKTTVTVAATFLFRNFLFMCMVAHPNIAQIAPADKPSLLASMFTCVGSCTKMHAIRASGLEYDRHQYCETGPFTSGSGHSCNFDEWDVSRVEYMTLREWNC